MSLLAAAATPGTNMAEHLGIFQEVTASYL